MALSKPLPMGLVGGSYTIPSTRADSNRTINWIPESLPGNRGAILNPSPGLELFIDMVTYPTRGSIRITITAPTSGSSDEGGYGIVVAGNTVYLIHPDATKSTVGTVSNDNRPVSMATNNEDTLIISDGKGYVVTGAAIVPITDADFPGNITTGTGVRALKCGYSDGYFIVVADNGLFYLSELDDPMLWDPIDVGQLQASENKLVSMIIDHKELFIFGSQVSQAFHNVGNIPPLFPFDPVPGGRIELGCAARDSVVKGDNSFFLLGEDDRGPGVMYRVDGWHPSRISDHGMEYQLQRNPHIIETVPTLQSRSALSRAVAFTYQHGGHTFYVLNSVETDQTFVYDATTRMIHERLSWNPQTAAYEAWRPWNHVYLFGKHLVGDRENGKLYSMSDSVFTEDGNVIRRLRRCPEISAAGDRVTHTKIVLIGDAGIGLPVAAGQPGYDPQIVLEYSDDGGVSFPYTDQCSAGKLGERETKMEFRGLGSTDVSRVYQFICTDPVPYRFTESFLTVDA